MCSNATNHYGHAQQGREISIQIVRYLGTLLGPIN